MSNGGKYNEKFFVLNIESILVVFWYYDNFFLLATIPRNISNCTFILGFI